MSIRLVVVDIDGTLLDDELVVSPLVIEKVEQLHALGVGFTLATGRVFSSAALIARQLRLQLPLITNGGAVVQRLDGEPLSHLTLPPIMVRRVLEYTKNWPGQRYLLTRDSIYAETSGPHAESYAHRLKIPVRVSGDLLPLAEQPVTQLVLRLDHASAGRLAADAQIAFGRELAVDRSMPHLVEFMHQGASKGRALRLLTESEGLVPAQVMAVGDGINDLDMLEVAGRGVLVGNADRQLWERADYVTEAHHYRGVLEALAIFLNSG